MQRFFFQPKHRLLTKQDFSQVFDHCSVRIGRGPILLLALPNKLNHPRIGLVCRKKFIKSAVGRNRFKRVARECFRLSQHGLPPLDIVVLNRSGSDTINNDQLQKLFVDAFDGLAKKAGRVSE